jgi:putative oxidoreductase
MGEAGAFGYTAPGPGENRGFLLLHVDRTGAPPNATGGLSRRIAQYQPYALAILRIVTALLFFEHGSARMIGFPANGAMPELFTLYWFAGAIEFACGALIALGLFTRSAAFVASGEMAFAYFMRHASAGFFPLLNRGDGAILYCFVFFYIVFAGAGAWSLDALLRKRG